MELRLTFVNPATRETFAVIGVLSQLSDCCLRIEPGEDVHDVGRHPELLVEKPGRPAVVLNGLADIARFVQQQLRSNE